MPLPGQITLDKAQDPDFLARTRLFRQDTPFSELASARFVNGFQNTILYGMYNLNDMEAALRSDPITGSATQQRKAWEQSPYFRRDIEFRPGMTWDYARLLALHKDAQNSRESRIARSPGGLAGFTAGAIGIVGVAADPINFIPVIAGAKSVAVVSRFSRGFAAVAPRVGKAAVTSGTASRLTSVARGISKATGMTFKPGMRKALTRIGIVGLDAALTEAIAQPILKQSFILRQEEFNAKTMFMNIGFAFGVGSAFGAVGATMRGWATNRRLRALDLSIDDELNGRPVDVAKHVQGENLRAKPTGANADNATLIERLSGMEDANISKFANVKAKTGIGKKISAVFARINRIKKETVNLGEGSEEVINLGNSTARFLDKNPEVAAAMANLVDLAEAGGEAVDNMVNFGKYSRAAADVIPERTMKQLDVDSPALAEGVRGRAKVMKEEMAISKGPEIVEGKRTKSTRPKWVQALLKKKVVNTIEQFNKALDRIIAGTDDKIPVSAKKIRAGVQAIKRRIVHEFDNGFDVNEAPLWGQMIDNGANPQMQTQLRILDGFNGSDDLKARSPELDDVPDTPTLTQARETVRSQSVEKLDDEISLEAKQKELEISEEDFRQANPDQFVEGKPKSADLQKLNKEIGQMENVQQAFNFFSNCALKG